MMDDKDYRIGDLVWAKMRGYPAWPAKIVERTEPPLTKNHRHYVYFFGSKNHAWIMDEDITPHSPSRIAEYENKKTLPALREAINEITEYIQSLPPTSNSDEEMEISDEEVVEGSDDDVEISDEVESFKCSEDDSSRPGSTSESVAKDLEMKHKQGEGSQERKQSCPKASKAIKRKADVLSGNDASVSDVNSDTANVQSPIVLPTDKKIGILGLGSLGLTIVKHILESGHNVTVWDSNVGEGITEMEGAHVVLSPMDVAQQCDVTISCVEDSEGANLVLNGEYSVLRGLEGCNGAKGYVEMICVGAQKSREIAEVMTQIGATYLEAPLMGPVNNPESAESAIFASGDKELYDCCLAVFHIVSSRVRYVSDVVGQAAIFIAACQSFVNATRTAVTQSMVLARRWEVSMPNFLLALCLIGYNGPLIIEQATDILKNNSDTPVEEELKLLKEYLDEPNDRSK